MKCKIRIFISLAFAILMAGCSTLVDVVTGFDAQLHIEGTAKTVFVETLLDQDTDTSFRDRFAPGAAAQLGAHPKSETIPHTESFFVNHGNVLHVRCELNDEDEEATVQLVVGGRITRTYILNQQHQRIYFSHEF